MWFMFDNIFCQDRTTRYSFHTLLYNDRHAYWYNVLAGVLKINFINMEGNC